MEPFSSKQQCGFRKGYSTQYCLLLTFQKYKSSIAKERYLSAFLTDLSKAFDYVFYERFPAKLRAYDFSLINFFLNCLIRQKQKLKHKKKTYDNALPDYTVDLNRGNVKAKISIKEKLLKSNYVQN